MKLENSLRRRQAARQEAKETLAAFLRSCSLMIPAKERADFRAELSQPRYNVQIGVRGQSPYGRFTEAFTRILRATAKQYIPSNDDLGVLTDALNQPMRPIHYQHKAYQTRGVSPVRSAAQSLLHYLNQTAIAGPVHAACAVCDTLFVTKRGGKKYCSADCRKDAWSYDSRKTLHAEYRKLRKLRKAQEKRPDRLRLSIPS